MKTQKNALDLLVANCTAFRTWEEMRGEMEKGYIPTLNGGKSYAKLAQVAQRNGYKVYRLGRVS